MIVNGMNGIGTNATNGIVNVMREKSIHALNKKKSSHTKEHIAKMELIVTQKDIDQIQREYSSYSGELVRCKDCKHGEVWNNCIMCNSGAHNPDWFCADGEKR